MTDFMVFLKTGLSVLERSNYDVFQAFSELNSTNIRHNVGLYVLIGYWSTFLLVLVFLLLIKRKCDKRSL